MTNSRTGDSFTHNTSFTFHNNNKRITVTFLKRKKTPLLMRGNNQHFMIMLMMIWWSLWYDERWRRKSSIAMTLSVPFALCVYHCFSFVSSYNDLFFLRSGWWIYSRMWFYVWSGETSIYSIFDYIEYIRIQK